MEFTDFPIVWLGKHTLTLVPCTVQRLKCTRNMRVLTMKPVDGIIHHVAHRTVGHQLSVHRRRRDGKALCGPQSRVLHARRVHRPPVVTGRDNDHLGLRGLRRRKAHSQCEQASVPRTLSDG